MATRQLDKAAWQKTFELLGMSYDPGNERIEILVEGLDHLIPRPREVWIDHGPAGLVSMEVIDADDVRQIIRLREPLKLPYSGTA